MSNSSDDVTVSDSVFPRVASDLGTSNPEVIPGASEYGNRYSLRFKLKVLRESDECVNSGDIGKYLRQVGITHTTLSSFRKQRAAGSLEASSKASPQKSSAASTNVAKPSVQNNTDKARKVMELEREVRKLKQRLAQAEAIIDMQEKVARLLEISLDPSDG